MGLAFVGVGLFAAQFVSCFGNFAFGWATCGFGGIAIVIPQAWVPDPWIALTLALGFTALGVGVLIATIFNRGRNIPPKEAVN